MKISIITASYNSGKTIRHTVESVLRQTYPDYEYIAGYYAWDGVIYKKDETD